MAVTPFRDLTQEKEGTYCEACGEEPRGHRVLCAKHRSKAAKEEEEEEPKLPPHPDDDFPLTEQGDAEFLAAHYGHRVRFNHRRRLWLVFNKHHWMPEDKGQLDRVLITSVRNRQHYAVGDKKRMHWALKGEAARHQNNIARLARSIAPIADRGDGWDESPMLLGVPNGVVDLETGTLRPGKPEDRISKLAQVEYDPDAQCPRWDRFMEEVFRQCPAVAGYIQRCLGYSLTGLTNEQVFWILWGEGANGKSTLIETFTRHVLGTADYCWTMPFPTAGWSNAMTEYQKASLQGRRLVLSSEVEQRGKLNEQLIKSLTGDDTINARLPYGAPFQFVPVAKFWLRVNDKPVIHDQSHAMWRRVRLVPFLETFPINLELPKLLSAEASGILAWAVRGCVDWYRNGLQEPDTVLAATAEYREKSNPLNEFIEERCVVSEEVRVRSSELFAAYRQWVGNRPERMDQKAFSKAVEGRFGVERDTRRNSPTRGVWYPGIGLLARGAE